MTERQDRHLLFVLLLVSMVALVFAVDAQIRLNHASKKFQGSLILDAEHWGPILDRLEKEDERVQELKKHPLWL